MKLTKGKISKLYNKKKQTFKKHKKRNISKKIRTFRKRHLNLARKTLKRYKKKKGGDGGNDTKTALIEETPREEEVVNPHYPFLKSSEKLKEENVPLPQQEDANPFIENKIDLPLENVPLPQQEETSKFSSNLPVKMSPNKGQVINSLNEAVDYIADTIADKVTDKVASNIVSGDKQQDGFDAVNTAIGIMSSKGGKKRTRRRHFRLTNKNKTQRI